MHIPDGFLNFTTSASTWVLSSGWLVWAMKRARARVSESAVAMMGMMAAFVFVAQMVNFPVLAGTSGHLIGSVLAVVLLGPAIASVVMAMVICLQCLLFQDGGVVALGANLFNMGVIGVLGGYICYRCVRLFVKGNRGVVIGAGVGAWCSVVGAALMCSLQLSVSGVIPLHVVAPAMVGIHALIGLGEAFATCLVVHFVLRTRPELVSTR